MFKLIHHSFTKGHLVNKQKSQSGFVHLGIVVIILSVALIGTLGFVFYQNFVEKKSYNLTNTSKEVVKGADQNKDITDKTADSSLGSFSNDIYSFNYPKTGWTVEDTKDSQGRVYIKSSDYKEADPESGTISMTEGSVVTIYKSNEKWNIDETIESFKTREWVKDVKSLTVDGQKAYSYYFVYEFPRYNTVFNKNNFLYNITFNAAGEKYESYKNAYDLVNESLKIK